MTEEIFKQEAKSITDLLFESGAFRENIKRDEMNKLEALLETMLRSRMNMYIDLSEFVKEAESKARKS